MAKEINEKELDTVNGGTCAEVREIISAAAANEGKEGLGKATNIMSYIPSGTYEVEDYNIYENYNIYYYIDC